MASELIVQTLKGPTSGANANKVIIPSGQTLDIDAWSPPAGAVVQIQDGRTISYTSHNTTSYTDTNLSVEITPKFANSKLYFWVSGVYWWNVPNAGGNYFMARIVDSRTGNSIMPQGGSYESLWFQGSHGAHDTYDRTVTGYTSIDNDSTTTRTYKVQARLFYASNTVNCFEHTADNIIRVMEVAQ
jgi:hypothetical protein